MSTPTLRDRKALAYEAETLPAFLDALGWTLRVMADGQGRDHYAYRVNVVAHTGAVYATPYRMGTAVRPARPQVADVTHSLWSDATFLDSEPFEFVKGLASNDWAAGWLSADEIVAAIHRTQAAYRWLRVNLGDLFDRFEELAREH